ncbi:MAG: DUF115 domain-containing protein [Lachnospiraceae bacterium]|nr:DUF115 domain-containing protein [Lachnospiraceae bacterium]
MLRNQERRRMQENNSVEKELSFFIWGAGNYGKKAGLFWGDFVEAYIDGDCNLQGTFLLEKPIISFESYLSEYGGRGVILISNLHYKEIKEFLDAYQIENYTLLWDCPSEVIYNQNQNLVKEYLNQLLQYKTLAIYGWNAYSLWLYRWLNEKGKRVYMVDNPLDASAVNKVKLEKSLQEYVLSREDFSEDTEVVVGASYRSEIQDSRYRDCFNFYRQLNIYDNKQILLYKNKYQGKRCFIVATGPSIKMEDLELLHRKKEYCFGMNKIFYLLDKVNWKPNFYFVSDPKIMSDYAEEIEHCMAGAKFAIDLENSFWKRQHSDDIIKYHGVYGGTGEDIFCEDLEKGVSANYTVTYVCMQFAIYMGFKEIYLIGVDHNYNGQINDGQNHVYGNMDHKAKTISYRSTYMENAEKSYRSAKKYAEAHGIKIYNATRGGKLEIFERVEFDSLFD